MATKRRPRRRVMSSTLRILTGCACAIALVLGTLSVIGRPAQATGAGTWTVDSGSALTEPTGLNTISCPDTTYCVALDENQYDDDALIWSSGTWHTVPLAEPGGTLNLVSVSCASETFCLAVGIDTPAGSGIGTSAPGVTEVWNGSAWSIIANPESSGNHPWLAGVSCPTTTSCFMVGRDATVGGFVDSWNGTSWTQAVAEQDVSFESISCSSTTSSATVGGGSSNSLTSMVLAGGTWTPEAAPDPGAYGSLTAVSCASSTFCMAVGSDEVDNVGYGTGLTENWDGESWQVVPSPNYPDDDLGPGFLGGGILLGVSCASAQACVAVGYSDAGGVNSQGLGYPGLALVETWDGIAWSLTPTPAPVEPVGVVGQVQLAGASCLPDAGDAQCVVVGTQGSNNDGGYTAFVERTAAAVGSLDATSTQVQTDGQGDATATVTTPASSEVSGAFRALDVAPIGSSPTGGVTFFANGVPANCRPALLDAGHASCSLGTGTTGPITAVYTGDTTYDGSSSQPVGTLPVTYSGNGSTNGSVPVDSASPYSSYATVSVLGPGSLAKSGSTFTGWNTKANGTGTSYAPGSTLTILAATKLYAIWTATPPPTTTTTTTTAPPPTTTTTTAPPPPTTDARQPRRASADYHDDDSASADYHDDDDDDTAPPPTTTTTTAPPSTTTTTTQPPPTTTTTRPPSTTTTTTQLSAGPALHPSASQLDFGPTTLGTYNGPLSVTLANTGSVTDHVTGYEFSGDNDFLFEGTQSQCATALAPGASCVLQFDFLPGAVGTRTESLRVLDSAASGVTISLAGVGSVGYYQVTSQGTVSHAGDAGYYGEVTTPLNKPIVAIAPTGDNGGYWLAGSDGGVFSFGDAHFYGSTGSLHLNNPIVGMTADHSSGYWFVASDGGIFSYGSAQFFGSTGGMHLNKPIVGMAATTDGGGYWLVASDGGIFSYGDTRFFGSTGGLALNKPIVGMVPTPDEGGYWLVASDGGIFSYGDARFFGSAGGIKLAQPIVGMAAMPDAGGYWFTAADGGLFNYGTAPFEGSAVDSGSGAVVGIATDGDPTVQAQGSQPAVRRLRSNTASAGVPTGTPHFAGPSSSGH